MVAVLFSLIMISGAATHDSESNNLCSECQVDSVLIQVEVERLRSATKWQSRLEAAEALGLVRWQCHPEVVDSLVEVLRADKKAKVRAEAAGSLGRMVPNLPSSHVALRDASKSDPVASVRKGASRALAAKGRRCVVDCPICGPLPKGEVITGPSITLPERDTKPSPAIPEAIPH